MSHAPNQSATEDEGNEVARLAKFWDLCVNLPLDGLIEKKIYIENMKLTYWRLESTLTDRINIINHFIKQKTK